MAGRPVAVVTGAGSGLGKALALELARRGHDVVGCDLEEARLEALAPELEALGSRLVGLRVDVTVPEGVEGLRDAAMHAGGRLDVWVNNAGVAVAGEVGDVPLADWRWLLEVNLMGVVHGCHVAVPVMRRQGSGRILNVASAAGLVSTPGMAAYNASKAAVVALTETLAGELAGTGVGATVLCPTFFPTNLLDTARSADERHRRTAHKLMQRSTWTAADVARVALTDLEAGRLYSVPMADGRWLWRLKRAAPDRFGGLLAWGARRIRGG